MSAPPAAQAKSQRASSGPEKPIFGLHFLSQERARGARVVQNGILIWYCVICDALVTCRARNRVSTPVTTWGREAKFSTGRFASCFGLCGFGHCYRCQYGHRGGSVTIVVDSFRHHRPSMEVALALHKVGPRFAFLPAPGIDSEENLFNNILNRYQLVRGLARCIACVHVVQVQAGILGGSVELG